NKPFRLYPAHFVRYGERSANMVRAECRAHLHPCYRRWVRHAAQHQHLVRLRQLRCEMRGVIADTVEGGGKRSGDETDAHL
ncbi:MAG: hypothetical protein QXP01_03580, partial [Candidatus Hadarchaeum sp.]